MTKLLLLLWMIIGTWLRFTNLASLPPWTDECATITFSLGNSFHIVPLNQVISGDVLLQPLQPNPSKEMSDVVQRLFSESTHPPVYFVLAHLWMKIFPTVGGSASIWAARSLSALLGIISIPAMFALGCLAFRSRLVGQMAAAIMAMSPYTVFLGREARHYTLVILLLIGSLCCFITAIRDINRRQPLPVWICLTWVVVNSLGIATHYFFVLGLVAQGLVLLGQALRHIQQDKFALVQGYWWRIWVVAAGTLVGCLVWIPALQMIAGSEPTTWVSDANPRVDLLAPLARLLLWLISILVLLPTAATNLPLWLVIVSSTITVLFLLVALPYLVYGLKQQQQNPDTHLVTQGFLGYVVGAIATFLVFTYGLGMDLTLAARFQYVCAPAIILLLGASLAGCWQSQKQQADKLPRFTLLKNAQASVAIIFLMVFCGGLTMVGNLGYLQNHRPDILAPIIQKASQVPVLIATTHKHHGQTGRMMGLAWEFKKNQSSTSVTSQDWQFFLLHRDSQTKSYTESAKVFAETLKQIPRPLDLWLVDFRTTVDLESQNCLSTQTKRASAGEYRYQLYHCVQKN
ncbi:MAG: glycosyltransferase family 39 protein [Nostocaceae cyanobacterium]|nr:glycosyltransferase family 39 protein [Nostocaceae cyanobacterium]